MDEKLMTAKEVADYLRISEDDVRKLVESDKLPAYKVGGAFLRFKKEQVDRYVRTRQGRMKKAPPYSFVERLEDFLYYNDFYILSVILLILIILAIIEL